MNRKELPAPPVCRRERTQTSLHGKTLVDDYAWLRQKENPETIAYLEAENAYAEAWLEPHQQLREELYGEMLSHIQQTDVSVAYRDGQFWYYSRTEEDKQYSIFCRKPGSDQAMDEGAPEEVLLDGNQLAEGQAFFSIGDTDISDDGHLLAYTTDLTGFRQYTLHIKDLRTGLTRETIAERVGSVAWAANSKTLFYTIEDEVQKRQFQLYRYCAQQSQAAALVYEEADERFNLAVGRTRDGAYLVMESASHITSESWALAANTPTGKFQLIAAREDDHEYSIDHRNGLWYIRTNDAGRNFRLVTAPVSAPGREHWSELIPHRPEVMLEDVELFQDFFVTCDREDGLPRLRLWHFQQEVAIQGEEISFPEPAYSAYPHINCIFATKKFRYGYQSLVTPNSVFEYDLSTKSSTLLKQTGIPGGFDRTLYASERIHARASDGVLVPISLVYRKDKFIAGRNPLYVYGYGSYGYSLPLNFSSNRLSLLDRGVVMAYAHIRGGGDLGEPWHDEGKMLTKMNTFTDFIACAEHLVQTGYGEKTRVAIEGGSAGGLLMGAVTNLRPDLFRAVLSHVPFVDVMNTMLDASLPLTVPEYEEWGNPNEEPYFSTMLSYSPYDNLKPGAYPAMLVKTSLNDSQVSTGNPPNTWPNCAPSKPTAIRCCW